MLPVIAIVGRPNVGKSTLFNRIVGRRKALVNDTVGVTRDRHYAEADWIGYKFILIDTGGLATGTGKTIQAAVRKQTLMAIEEADLVVVVFDGREEPNELDRHIVELLRKAGKPVVYCVNKIDNVKSDKIPPGPPFAKGGEIVQFYELGIKGDLLPISAEHGIGVDALLDTVVSNVSSFKFQVSGFDSELRTSNSELRTPNSELRTSNSELRVAIIGRPNAGKSTLINRLAGSERVIAHEMPGTTRDTIDVEIKCADKKYIFVDTAGLKKRGKTIETIDKFSAIKTLDAIGRADIVLLMVDSNEGFTHQDRSLVDHAYSEDKPMAVLFNKWDMPKAKELEIPRHKRQLGAYARDDLLRPCHNRSLLQLHRLPFLCISAKTGLNVSEIFEQIEYLEVARKKRLSTSELNNIMEELKMSHNIPTYKGRAVKIFYATQVSIAPPTFVVFTNQPEGVHESYKRYLTNHLQDIIGVGVPIRIKFKAKS